MEKSTQMLRALLGRLEVPIFAPIPNLWKDKMLRFRRQELESFRVNKLALCKGAQIVIS